LGLTISKEIAHALGGDINVESHVDQGSIFTLKIPVEVVNPEQDQIV
jgi:signal transduction histidine kinase